MKDVRNGEYSDPELERKHKRALISIMKAEPLKEKNWKIALDEVSEAEEMFYKKDVASAVEWLKKNIFTNPPTHKAWDRCTCEECVHRRFLLTRIDEAFEDVSQNEANKTSGGK